MTKLKIVWVLLCYAISGALLAVLLDKTLGVEFSASTTVLARIIHSCVSTLYGASIVFVTQWLIESKER